MTAYIFRSIQKVILRNDEIEPGKGCKFMKAERQYKNT